jgi:hypothetical protein
VNNGNVMSRAEKAAQSPLRWLSGSEKRLAGHSLENGKESGPAGGSGCDKGFRG